MEKKRKYSFQHLQAWAIKSPQSSSVIGRGAKNQHRSSNVAGDYDTGGLTGRDRTSEIRNGDTGSDYSQSDWGEDRSPADYLSSDGQSYEIRGDNNHDPRHAPGGDP